MKDNLERFSQDNSIILYWLVSVCAKINSKMTFTAVTQLSVLVQCQFKINSYKAPVYNKIRVVF